MAEGGYEEIPMEERGHNEDHDDADESTPLFPDGTQDGGWTEGRRPSSHRSSSRHQYETGRGSSSGFRNPSYVSDVDEGVRLLVDEERDHSVLGEIRRKFPYFDPSNANFIFGEDEFGRVYVELKRKGGRRHFLYDGNGNLNKEIPKSITESLGPSVEELIFERNKRIEELRGENEGLRGTIRGRTSLRETENLESREKIRKRKEEIEEGEEKISALKNENERLNEEKERLKGENKRLREKKTKS